MASLKCRPTEAEKDPAMVFMSSAQMLALKLRNGDIVQITKDEAAVLAVAWLTTKSDLKEGVIGVSKWLQDRAGIKLGNEVSVSKAAKDVDESQNLVLKPLEEVKEDIQFWEINAKVMLPESYRYMASSQVVEVAVGRRRMKFEVLGPHDAIFKAATVTQIRIGTDLDRDDDVTEKISFDRIGGLQAQKLQLKSITTKVLEATRDTRSLRQHATGVLLHGPSGTGKTCLREALKNEFEWPNSVDWDGPGSKMPERTSRPYLVNIEIMNKLTANDAKLLRQMFRALPSTTLIIAEIRDPNDLQDFLRRTDTFANEIELPVPAAEQRLEIFEALGGRNLGPDLMQEAAKKTHGYTGDDISRLLKHIDFLVDERHGQQPTTQNPNLINGDSSSANTKTQSAGPELKVTSDDLALALTHVRPSALQQVFIEKPNVRWTDIGGQETFKERLGNAVEWPLKYPNDMKEFDSAPKKGVLLYGPPGCSKTMLVKALATESDYNFLAVKGAELLSMYVGESERATREVFRKARAASPCIVFFDEIDAIARRPGASSELNVLTTLLNELDGFEELKDVFVIAATNKPQDIDPALMRPGRFDHALYVGPPNASTREAILRYRFGRTKKYNSACIEAISQFVDQTEGMSGAEVVAVCQTAADTALEAYIRADRAIDRDITPEDVFSAIRTTPRAITRQMLEQYEAWNAERAAS